MKKKSKTGKEFNIKKLSFCVDMKIPRVSAFLFSNVCPSYLHSHFSFLPPVYPSASFFFFLPFCHFLKRTSSFDNGARLHLHRTNSRYFWNNMKQYLMLREIQMHKKEWIFTRILDRFQYFLEIRFCLMRQKEKEENLKINLPLFLIKLLDLK